MANAAQERLGRRWRRLRQRVLDVVVTVASVPVAIYLAFKETGSGRAGDACEELQPHLQLPRRCFMTDGVGGKCRWPKSPMCLQETEKCDFDPDAPACFQPRRLRLVPATLDTAS